MRIFLSTADASGDLHAQAFVAALRAQVPTGEPLELYGLGGDRLEGAGLEAVVRQSDLAVAGLVEVLGSARRIVASYRALRRELVERRPDLAVFVDSPDLNLPLAAVAKRAGIRTFYYVAPQVWAWRASRVKKLRARIDAMAVIFPFEQELFRDAGINAHFVGHPLVDRISKVASALKPDAVAKELGLDRSRPVLGLLPGSRRNEIERNLQEMIACADLLYRAHPDLQVQLMLAPTLRDLEPELPGHIRVVRGRTHEAMAVSTALLAAPGTVTVEAALLGVPLVVAHRVNGLTFEIARRLTRIPSTCMVNLIADRGVVPERLQEMASGPALAADLAPLLYDPERRRRMRDDLARAVAKLGGPGAPERAAALALEVVGGA